MSGHLLIRADASALIGIGHMMRCLALAQAWQDAGGAATVASVEMPFALKTRLAREGIEHRSLETAVASMDDAAATALLAHELDATWVAIDGYRFTPEFFATIRGAGHLALVIDDLAQLPHYAVDVILNQNLGASRELYSAKIEPNTQILLGPRFSLLRREFSRTCTKRTPLVGRSLRVLLTFGGSDPQNFTGSLLRRLAKVHRDYEVRVLAGVANGHVPTLLADAELMPFPCEVVVNTEDVAEQMAWADVAVSAGGSTVWELSAMRLPALIGAISEDQRIIGPALHRMSGFRAWTIEQLLMQDLGAEIEAVLKDPHDFRGFDALGALRVVEQLTQLPSLSESAA